MTLINCEKFKSHSGLELDFKIDCDYLTDSDIECIAKLIAKRTAFGHVYGIPRGGMRLEKALKPYHNDNVSTVLVVDDVLTTGQSMEGIRVFFEEHGFDVIGWVIFARKTPPEWVNAVFTLNEVIGWA